VFSYLAGVLRQVVSKCVVGAAVVDLCEMGDKLILEETGKVYKKEKELKKGEGGEPILTSPVYIRHTLNDALRLFSQGGSGAEPILIASL